MALELRQLLSQKMIMTPQLRQAIKLLQLSKIELQDYISDQLNENPILDQEQIPENEQGDPGKTGEDMIADQMKESGVTSQEADGAQLLEKIDWNQFGENNIPSTPGYRGDGDDLPTIENTLTRKETLHDHLSFQLNMLVVSKEEQEVGEYLINDIDDDGYFRHNFADYARVNNLDPDTVEDMLDVIQHFDPIGVGASNLKECLQIQIRFHHLANGVIEKIVEHHLAQLESKNYPAIAKSLKIDLDSVIESVKLLTELEPKPGRPFGDNKTTYITPDIYIYKDGDKWEISLNEDGMPMLKVSQFYKNALTQKMYGKEENEYIQDKMKSAIWLIKSIQQRQRTIYKVMESILQFQKDFFEHGVSALKPLVLRDVAEDISMHESTISRVTTNKYVHTPRGIFELKYFFNTSVSGTEGEELATESVKDLIRNVISSENPKKPLSDQNLAEKLKIYGVDIARRTVAKYREQMGFASSSKRKKYF